MYKKIAASLALAFAAAVTAQASPLLPDTGRQAVPAGTFGTLSQVANTGIRTATSSTFTVRYGEAVSFDSANPLGGLDFIYSFDNIGTTGILEAVSMGTYDGFLTDTIFVSKGVANQVAPTAVSHSSTGVGSVVNFAFDAPNTVKSGQTSDYLVIRTNATQFRTGNYSFIDNSTFTDTNTFVPSAVTPEPSSLILLGTGLLGAAGVARRKFATKFGV